MGSFNVCHVQATVFCKPLAGRVMGRNVFPLARTSLTLINMVRLKEHKANELPAGAALIFGIGLKKKSLSLTCVKMP